MRLGYFYGLFALLTSTLEARCSHVLATAADLPSKVASALGTTWTNFEINRLEHNVHSRNARKRIIILRRLLRKGPVTYELYLAQARLRASLFSDQKITRMDETYRSAIKNEDYSTAIFALRDISLVGSRPLVLRFLNHFHEGPLLIVETFGKHELQEILFESLRRFFQTDAKRVLVLNKFSAIGKEIHSDRLNDLRQLFLPLSDREARVAINFLPRDLWVYRPKLEALLYHSNLRKQYYARFYLGAVLLELKRRIRMHDDFQTDEAEILWENYQTALHENAERIQRVIMPWEQALRAGRTRALRKSLHPLHLADPLLSPDDIEAATDRLGFSERILLEDLLLEGIGATLFHWDAPI